MVLRGTKNKIEKHEIEAQKNLKTEEFVYSPAIFADDKPLIINSVQVTNQDLLNALNDLQVKNAPNKIKRFFFGYPKFPALAVALKFITKDFKKFLTSGTVSDLDYQVTYALDCLLLHKLVEVKYDASGTPLYGLTNYGVLFLGNDNGN